MNRPLTFAALALGAALLIGTGYWFGTRAGMTPDDTMAQGAPERKVLYWHDPMVPGQKFDKPGKSPFMDMQLVPKYADEASDSGVAIQAQVAQNLGIRLATVETARFGDSLTAVGRIEPDEHHLYVVQTRASGFVERLQVRAVGDAVRRGQKLAEIYAPELLSAQQEYLALIKLELPDAEALREAARMRLTLLGMSAGEITAIAQRSQANPRFGVYAPASGFVTELGVREGGQLQPGMSLMQIADLSTVWLIAEVPERDAARLKRGEAVETQLESQPGATLKGRIAHIYPTLDAATRTVRVRIALPNPQGLLRPGMFGTIVLSATQREVLAVPTESVIATGARKVVIVKENGNFRPAVVTIGKEREGKTEILQGVTAGEQVVVSGQFLIDSEASLAGMMARLSSSAMAEKAPPAATEGAIISTGKVTEIDVNAGTVTLAHDPIPALDWPSMTMGFKVRDARALTKLKVGEQVSFELNRKMEGSDYVIERLSPGGQP